MFFYFINNNNLFLNKINKKYYGSSLVMVKIINELEILIYLILSIWFLVLFFNKDIKWL